MSFPLFKSHMHNFTVMTFTHMYTHSREMIGMQPTKPDVTSILKLVNGTLNQIAVRLLSYKETITNLPHQTRAEQLGHADV